MHSQVVAAWLHGKFAMLMLRIMRLAAEHSVQAAFGAACYQGHVILAKCQVAIPNANANAEWSCLQALCKQIEQDYAAGIAQAKAEHEQLKASVQQQNDAAVAAARTSYADAIQKLQAEYDAACDALKQSHSQELERVRARNTEIWPQVGCNKEKLLVKAVLRHCKVSCMLETAGFVWPSHLVGWVLCACLMWPPC